LKELDENFHKRQPLVTETMLVDAKNILSEAGYKPYYLYRQKNIAGSTENIGYCKDDTLSLYNVRIMEEAQSIIALGAGGISKVYYPEENRLERIPNVSNYEIYIERIDEMLERKEKNLFRR
jgi:oxygen-independent coproporphyrinogen-3 oxidase